MLAEHVSVQRNHLFELDIFDTQLLNEVGEDALDSWLAVRKL